MATISDLLSIRSRLLRSIELERDFDDPAALAGYVLTPTARGHVERLATALLPNSTRRAWRVTGDYGSGKSTFGLLLARLFSGRTADLPAAGAQAVDWTSLGGEPPRLLPVLVTGTRASVADGVLRGLDRALGDADDVEGLRGRIADAGAAQGTVQEKLTLDLLQDMLRSTGAAFAGGLLLILDEVGKFLEAAALDPQRHDVYFLQQLAELASRSGERPFIVVGLLHQGFHAYAESLTGTAQKEWEKVAGRFEELLFDAPLEETAELVAGALQVDVKRLPASVIREAEWAMEQAHALGWYGMANRERLVACAPRLFPLHPMTLPVLSRVFARFGQNQRSLFTFLASSEPFGLQAFAAQEVVDGGFYRLNHLFDHVRVTLGQRLVNRTLRSQWFRVVGTIEGLPVEENRDSELLKAVGILNLLDDERMLPRPEALAAAMEGPGGAAGTVELADALRARRMLHLRGTSGGYRLWPHTSVDLERAFEDAGRALGSVDRVSTAVGAYLETRPMVARRHYIETGNLRYFEVRYSSVGDLARHLDRGGADGVILVALCDSEVEREEALAVARTADVAGREDVLVAIPRPLSALRDALEEVQRWEWVVANTPELGHDTYAAEEVSRHLRSARRVLTDRMRQFVGLHDVRGGGEIHWYRQGVRVLDQPRDRISAYLSRICDDVYPDAPHVHNELVNRASLSSAAAAARMRVIKGILERSTEPLLGIDADKAPPEKAVYFSLLQEGKLHRLSGAVWTITEPEPGGDECHLLPVFNCIRKLLAEAPDQRLSVAELIEALRRPPFGVREGLIPILLAVFAKANQARLAVYEDGIFMLDLTGFDFMRLIKAPATFEFQFCSVEGVRSEVFGSIVHVLQHIAPVPDSPDVVEAVTILARFVAQLPEYTRRTKRLSDPAQRVRTVLLESLDPPRLLFRELPEACGFAPFGDTPVPAGQSAEFAEALQAAIYELRGAYINLRMQIAAQLGGAFGLPSAPATLKDTLAERAATVRGSARDPNLVAFCFRLADLTLPPEEWLESVASFAAGKPPSRWQDQDADLFPTRLHPYAQQFRQAAQIAMQRGGHAAAVRGVCVSVTNQDGQQRERPVFFEQDAQNLEELKDALLAPMADASEELQIAALSQLLWDLIDRVEQDERSDVDAA